MTKRRRAIRVKADLRDRSLAATKDLLVLPVVEVTWVDSCTVHSWQSLKEARGQTLMTCKTVGHLIRNDRRMVAVVQSVNEGGSTSENWLIPRACVKRVRVLHG